LEALIVAAKFLTDRVVGKIDFDDMTAARSAAEQAAELAGGSKFSEFYLMLLGAE